MPLPLFNHLSQLECTRFKELATSLISRSQRDQNRQPSEDVDNSLLAPQSAYAHLKAEVHRTKLKTPSQAQSATFGQQARAAIDESANLSEQVKAAQEAASQMHLHDLEVQRNLKRNLAVLSQQVTSQLSTIELSNQKTAVLKQLVSTLRSRNQVRRQGSHVAQRKLVTFRITCARLAKDLRQVQQQLTRCQAQSSFLQARAEAASDRSVKMGKQLKVTKQSALQAGLQTEEVQRKLESALADVVALEASSKSCKVIIIMPATSICYHIRLTHMPIGHLLALSCRSCHALPELLSKAPLTSCMLKGCQTIDHAALPPPGVSCNHSKHGSTVLLAQVCI